LIIVLHNIPHSYSHRYRVATSITIPMLTHIAQIRVVGEVYFRLISVAPQLYFNDRLALQHIGKLLEVSEGTARDDFA
jgi:hypothetical protein